MNENINNMAKLLVDKIANTYILGKKLYEINEKNVSITKIE